MLNIVLNIVGILVVVVSLIFIKKDKSREDYFEINDFDNKKDNDFDGREFLREVESFNKVLSDKSENIQYNARSEEGYIKNENRGSINKSLNDGMNSYIEEDIDENKEDNKLSGIIVNAKTSKESLNNNKYNKEIVELKEEGYKIEEIAKRTGRSVREIEVILKMYNT